MKIILTEVDTGNYMTFPMLPEAINVECGTRFSSYDIMNVGEVKLPLGEELTRFSWKCTIPGEKRQRKNADGSFINPYLVVGHGAPKKVQEWFSYLKNSGVKCRLLITETPINHDVYIESYNMTYSGGFGDYECDISFVHAKELKVSTEKTEETSAPAAEVPNLAASAVPTAENTRPDKPQEAQYTVKSGDCLWDIAQRNLGNGGRYMEIAQLNGISNPNVIMPGQVLVMPER